MLSAQAQPEVFTFAVYPADMGDAFDAFLIDVPTLINEDAAARRAWWTAFHMLGPKGFEPEDFTVCAWRNDSPGPLVTSGGYS